MSLTRTCVMRKHCASRNKNVSNIDLNKLDLGDMTCSLIEMDALSE